MINMPAEYQDLDVAIDIYSMNRYKYNPDNTIKMKYLIEQGCDALELAQKVIGKKKAIINSGIFAHLFASEESGDDFDELHDIIVVEAKTDAGITIRDVLRAYRKMEKQFEKINGSNHDGRSFFYEGMRYNQKTKHYCLVWGS